MASQNRKYLGIFIDENLRWQTHIDKLFKKVASGIGAIKRIRPFVPPSTLHYIDNALIQFNFDYCNLVLANCGKTCVLCFLAMMLMLTA